MESLTLNEEWAQSRSAYRNTMQHRALRLPTPEVTRPEALQRSFVHHEQRSTEQSTGGYGCDRSQQPLTSPNSPSCGNSNPYLAHHRSAPHSPPYRGLDAQKPSLPPLKTVLGHNMSSPPQTPNPSFAAFQPSPQEPAYTTATYKPPSLYPNKKQKLDLLPASAQLFESTRELTSPRLAAPPIASQPSVVTKHTTDPITGIDIQHHLGRRYSVRPPLANPHDPRKSALATGAHFEGSQPYRTPEQTPTTMAYSGDFQPGTTYRSSIHDKRTRFGHHAAGSQRMQEPRNGSCDRSAVAADAQLCADATYRLRGRPQLSYENDCSAAYEADRHSNGSHATFSASLYHRSPYDPNSFFTPSQYEYQHGKARKRSNLPKQSTEIMKTWFDHNIVNPYPSEEQKAIFSRATGISMTQVSNWFINHRRRCPELRDRREKHRGNGRDGELL